PRSPSVSTLSLHDALPILSFFHGGPRRAVVGRVEILEGTTNGRVEVALFVIPLAGGRGCRNHHGDALSRGPAQGRHFAVAQLARSEEHTSELQSPDHLVCR